MNQRKIPAVFMRGGTSKAIIFKRADLPEDRADWDRNFPRLLETYDLLESQSMAPNSR